MPRGRLGDRERVAGNSNATSTFASHVADRLSARSPLDVADGFALRLVRRLGVNVPVERINCPSCGSPDAGEGGADAFRCCACGTLYRWYAEGPSRTVVPRVVALCSSCKVKPSRYPCSVCKALICATCRCPQLPAVPEYPFVSDVAARDSLKQAIHAIALAQWEELRCGSCQDKFFGETLRKLDALIPPCITCSTEMPKWAGSGFNCSACGNAVCGHERCVKVNGRDLACSSCKRRICARCAILATEVAAKSCGEMFCPACVRSSTLHGIFFGKARFSVTSHCGPLVAGTKYEFDEGLAKQIGLHDNFVKAGEEGGLCCALPLVFLALLGLGYAYFVGYLDGLL